MALPKFFIFSRRKICTVSITKSFGNTLVIPKAMPYRIIVLKAEKQMKHLGKKLYM
jgi:hypothetical protein